MKQLLLLVQIYSTWKKNGNFFAFKTDAFEKERKTEHFPHLLVHSLNFHNGRDPGSCRLGVGG